MTDSEILRIWNTLVEQRKIDARVYSCAVSAYENNEVIDTGRAVAVLHLVWPGVKMGAVPSEIRGRTAESNNNKNRQTDFSHFMQIIHGRAKEAYGTTTTSSPKSKQLPSSDLMPTLPSIPDSEFDVSAEEGRELLRLHRMRERNRGLVARKKRTVLSKSKRLVCEVCDFDFAAVYGPRGEGFAECHHTQFIAHSAPGRRTKPSELAVVCANCHRMLHRRPWVTVSELRVLVSSQRSE
jgi:predicted HNH restriction endonuclease